MNQPSKVVKGQLIMFQALYHQLVPLLDLAGCFFLHPRSTRVESHTVSTCTTSASLRPRRLVQERVNRLQRRDALLLAPSDRRVCGVWGLGRTGSSVQHPVSE